MRAELRAYQEDGFVWAMRLAQAGFGACLADDMGLGKTLQSLAVLLARSTGGAALVVAPTSVCGNWMAEAQRFAPGLHFVLYGESEREKLITAAGPGDVLVVSYNLMLQAILAAQSGLLVFTRDHLFTSPSMAAMAVMGRSANGWIEWKAADGKTLDEVKRQVVGVAC